MFFSDFLTGQLHALYESNHQHHIRMTLCRKRCVKGWTKWEEEWLEIQSKLDRLQTKLILIVSIQWNIGENHSKLGIKETHLFWQQDSRKTCNTTMFDGRFWWNVIFGEKNAVLDGCHHPFQIFKDIADVTILRIILIMMTDRNLINHPILKIVAEGENAHLVDHVKLPSSGNNSTLTLKIFWDKIYFSSHCEMSLKKLRE